MMSIDRRPAALAAAVVIGALSAPAAFAQDDQSIETIVREKSAQPHVIWKPLLDAPGEAWSHFADAAHLKRPSSCKHHGPGGEPRCLHWTLSARYTATQDENSNALTERVDDDVHVQMNQQAHFFLFWKRPF
jgi:hypothetical protein